MFLSTECYDQIYIFSRSLWLLWRIRRARAEVFSVKDVIAVILEGGNVPLKWGQWLWKEGDELGFVFCFFGFFFPGLKDGISDEANCKPQIIKNNSCFKIHYMKCIQ